MSLILRLLSSRQWYMAAKNTNTNERINASRYDYLKDAHGHFYNPYDRGFVNNMKEFFLLKPSLTEEEVHRAKVYTVWGTEPVLSCDCASVCSSFRSRCKIPEKHGARSQTERGEDYSTRGTRRLRSVDEKGQALIKTGHSSQMWQGKLQTCHKFWSWIWFPRGQTFWGSERQTLEQASSTDMTIQCVIFWKVRAAFV